MRALEDLVSDVGCWNQDCISYLIVYYRNTRRNHQGFKFHPELKKEGSLHKKISAGEQGVTSTLWNCPVWLWFMMVFHPHGIWIMDVILLFTGRRIQVHKEDNCNPCKWYNRLRKRVSVESVICHIWGHSLQCVYHDLLSFLELPLESANACQHGTCLCDHVILQHPVLKEANNRTCILLHTLNLKI